MNRAMKTLLSHGLRHPARSMSFNRLEKGLLAQVAKGNINVTYHPEIPHLAIFKYSTDCVIERNWNLFTLMARGLVLDMKNRDVVATPFMKFFNFNEIEDGSVSIVEKDYIVTEKVDGSLGIMFFYDEKWIVATAGSFASEQAVWATKWVRDNLRLGLINELTTYLFEIVYPENKIVINYDFSGLVLLGVFNGRGYETYGWGRKPSGYETLVEVSEIVGARVAQYYDFNDMASIVDSAKKLDVNEEGYVIRFASGVRLKVKGDEYVRIHRLISKLTPLAIWKNILLGEDLSEIKRELPEEMERDFDTIVSILTNKLAEFVAEVEALHKKTEHMTDKELGLYLRTKPVELDDRKFKTSIGYIFPLRKGKFYDSLSVFDSMFRNQVFKTFKPKRNILPGYVPSTIVNRFTDGPMGV